MRKLIAVLFLVVSLLISSAASADNPNNYKAPLFSTEAAAKQHCPSDTVVWLNDRSGIYQLKNQRWYGKTLNGSFVCRKEADKAGYHPVSKGHEI